MKISEISFLIILLLLVFLAGCTTTQPPSTSVPNATPTIEKAGIDTSSQLVNNTSSETLMEKTSPLTGVAAPHTSIPDESTAPVNKGEVSAADMDRSEQFSSKGFTELMTIGHDNDAFTSFDVALQYNPENDAALIGKAIALTIQEKNDDAAAALDKALSINATNKTALDLKEALHEGNTTRIRAFIQSIRDAGKTNDIDLISDSAWINNSQRNEILYMLPTGLKLGNYSSCITYEPGAMFRCFEQGYLNLFNFAPEDAVVTVTVADSKNPLAVVLIRNNGYFTLGGLPTGIYNVYYEYGTGWNNQTKQFNSSKTVMFIDDDNILPKRLVYDKTVLGWNLRIRNLTQIFDDTTLYLNVAEIPRDSFPKYLPQ